ncbi:hypothetical protein JYT87_01995 [Nitrospira defluvii]|nr:hypothetical protein [Nitrospira defluvii]
MHRPSLFKSILQSIRLSLYKRRLVASSDPLKRLEGEVLKKIVGGPYMGGAYEFTDFKKDYYDFLSPDKQEKVRRILLKIIRSSSAWRWPSSVPVRAAYVCLDLQMEEARTEIQRMLSDPRYQESCGILKAKLDMEEKPNH